MDVPDGQLAIGFLVPLITIVSLKSFATVDSSRCAHVGNHRHGGRGKPGLDQCPLAPCGVEVWNTLLMEEPSLFSCLGSPQHDALPRHKICKAMKYKNSCRIFIWCLPCPSLHKASDSEKEYSLLFLQVDTMFLTGYMGVGERTISLWNRNSLS